MELIFMCGAVACVGIGGIAGVYHWVTGNGSPMDDVCIGGLAANVMLFAALLVVML